LPKPDQVEFEEGKKYYWKILTNLGAMKFELYHKVAPMHVTSTLYLTQLGFYDNTYFHRVIKRFMAQGGDPKGTGRGGPGYRYDGEFDKATTHDGRGILSMANKGKGTDGSQFFITFKATPHLDGKHTVFGKIVEGMETLSAIERMGSHRGKPKKPIMIEEATIEVSGGENKPIHYSPEKA
jgi:cyclophilin family peptidyl-prolyl cis-trans isomerase